MDTITTIADLMTCNGSATPVTVDLTPSAISLIVAAPELLEALEEFSAEYDGFENGDGNPCPTLAKARAAIAKALGTEVLT